MACRDMDDGRAAMSVLEEACPAISGHQFPIEERTVKETIGGLPYTLIIKGNTVVPSIRPARTARSINEPTTGKTKYAGGKSTVSYPKKLSFGDPTHRAPASKVFRPARTLSPSLPRGTSWFDRRALLLHFALCRWLLLRLSRRRSLAQSAIRNHLTVFPRWYKILHKLESRGGQTV